MGKIAKIGEMGGNERICQNGQKCPKYQNTQKWAFLGKYPKIEILATTATNTQGRLDVIIILKTTPGVV